MVVLTRRARALCTAALLIALFLLIAGPWLYVLICWDRFAGVRGLPHRRRVARWQSFFGEAVLSIVSRCMGISVHFELPRPPLPNGPYLIVSNHLGGFDGYIIISILRKLGGEADLRAISKSQMRSMPIVGRAWRELGWGFVTRKRDPRDFDAVKSCGRLAVEDDADVLIFPEGTIFERQKRKGEYLYVLPPKVGGFKALRALMPDRPVLSVTLRWECANHGLSLYDGSIPYGRHVTVEARFGDIPEDVEAWLQHEWQRKDMWIIDQSDRSQSNAPPVL